MSVAGTPVSAPTERRRSVGASRHAAFVASLVGSAAVLVAGFLWSVSIGTEDVGIGHIVSSVVSYDPTSPEEAIARLLRMPRAVLAILVGANLAIAGVILQGITRNALGAPEILGVNAGAAFVVAITTTLFASFGGLTIVWLAFLGASGAMALVFAMAYFSRGGLNPVRLALAGVTVSTLLFSIMQGVMLLDTETQQSIYFWLVGGVNYASWGDAETVAPWLAIGTVLAFLLAPRLNLLALGEDVARGLGQNVQRTRLMGAAAVVLLAGAAVGVGGPVTFIGLIVPHIARRLVGVNHFRVLPVAGLLGASVFVYADVASRYINPPTEIPAGIVTAVFGAPVFIYLARRSRMREQS